MIVCPACGRPTEPGWSNCLNCGKALIQSRIKPGDTLPPRELPQQPAPQQPQYQQPVPQQQYAQGYQQPQQQYQQQYQPRRKSCFGRFIGWLLLAAFLWYLFTHLIPALADLHTLFDGEYTTPHEVGQWFARLIP